MTEEDVTGSCLACLAGTLLTAVSSKSVSDARAIRGTGASTS
jgi:hypothetical protein